MNHDKRSLLAFFADWSIVWASIYFNTYTIDIVEF